MRLNTVLIGIAAVSIALASLVLVPITEKSFDWVYSRLSKGQLSNFTQVLTESVELRRSFLRNLARVVQSDTNLASAFVLSRYSKDNTMLDEILDDLRERSNLVFVGIALPDLSNSRPVEGDRCFEKVSRAAQMEVFCEWEGRTVLASLNPLKLYGELAGYLYLVSEILPSPDGQINRPTPAQVVLSVHSSVDNIRLLKVGETSLFASISPDLTLLAEVTSSLRKSVFLGVAISVSLMMILFLILLDRMFLRSFKRTVASLEVLSKELEGDVINEYQPVTSKIAEVGRLQFALSTYFAKLRQFERRLKDSNAKAAESERNAALSNLARQLAHDIRSPISALNLAVSEGAIPNQDHKNLLLAAAKRINSIANDLLVKYKGSNQLIPESSSGSSLNYCVVYLDIESVVLEKRALLGQSGIKLDFSIAKECMFQCAGVEPVLFQRVLSNVINNSIEALGDSGHIEVAIVKRGEQIAVTVVDDGPGIPKEILKKLGLEEVTHGKQNGSGIGIFAAATSLRKVGGDLLVTSQLGQGTRVELLLPLVAPPDWLATKLVVHASQEIVIVDDDFLIHDTWRARLAALSLSQTVILTHIVSPNDFETWIREQSDTSRFQFLFDYEFYGASQTGLNLIASSKIQKQSTLITGKPIDRSLIAALERLEVKVIPKPLLADVEILSL